MTGHPSPPLAGRLWLALAFLLLLGVMRPAGAAVPEAGVPEWFVDRAELVTPAGEREVRLPHVLEPGDFERSGSRVRYRLSVELDDAPGDDLAIFVPKMSLAGVTYLNGIAVGRCVVGELERVRCLHQPQIVVPPRELWRAGVNLVEVELFASARQANGLSAVTIGPAERLAEGPFATRYFLQVELLRGLAWAMVCLGLGALVLALLVRDTPGFAWFGLATIVNALCNLNVLVQRSLVSVDFFSWFVFSSRLASVPLLLLTFLVFFGRDTAPRRRFLAGSALLMPVVVWASGNDVRVVTAMYVPFLLLAPVMLVGTVKWAWQSRRPRHLLGSLAFVPTVAAGVHDWVKFTGVASFERTYLLSYANALTLILLAAILIATIAAALKRSRGSAAVLRRRVRQREAELRAWYAERAELERAGARWQERERLLRDMHDGIGSSLSSARILLRSGRLSAGEAADVLQECSDDLRLMVDASGNPEGSLENALADFRYRIDQRIDPSSLALDWQIAVADMPPMSTDDLLQLMRIVQESFNNAIRHAKAARVEIRALWDAARGTLEISVRDDGCGFGSAERKGRGMGLENMHRRAAALGARLDFEDAAPGTRVRLRMTPAGARPA